jgi:hypothetical protein
MNEGARVALVDSGFTAFGDQIQDGIRADRLLAVDLEPAIAACFRLSELPGISGTRGPKGDRRVCERTTARLDLPLETNSGRSWSVCVAQYACASAALCSSLDYQPSVRRR